MDHHHPRTCFAALGLGLVLATGLASACTDDGNASADPTSDGAAFDSSTTTTRAVAGEHDGHDAESMAVTIEGVDYAFSDVPDTVPAGTTLTFQNTSATELHEMVVFRLPDDVDTPIDELVQLPPAELEATLGAPVTVMLQPPGAPEPIQAVGDGTLAEPGRYAVMCFIPIGADPGEYVAAAQAAGGGKPEGVAGGPPHFTAGMYAELTVQ